MHVLPIALVVLVAIPQTPLTPKGRHCPTALVQTVTESSDSGLTVRALRQGERDFKQCCCAEERRDQTRCEATNISVTLGMPLGNLNCYSLAGVPPDSTRFIDPEDPHRTRNDAPESPPPR